jgi:hypothetical protein
MRPQATSACGLKLLAYEALRYQVAARIVVLADHRGRGIEQVLNLLALLVQKHKY